MTRKGVYACALVGIGAATTLTTLSILSPEWITTANILVPNTYIHFGLSRRCIFNNRSPSEFCTPFPSHGGGRTDHDHNWTYLHAWILSRRLVYISLFLELLSAVVGAAALMGLRRRRMWMWKVMCGLLGVVGVLEGMVGLTMVEVLQRDSHFGIAVFGFGLDKAWDWCCASAGVALVTAGGLAIAAEWFPEGVYLGGDMEKLEGEGERGKV